MSNTMWTPPPPKFIQPVATDVTHTVTATATCSHCPWTAQMTGDTPKEVADFLRTLLLQHVADLHHPVGKEPS